MLVCQQYQVRSALLLKLMIHSLNMKIGSSPVCLRIFFNDLRAVPLDAFYDDAVFML